MSQSKFSDILDGVKAGQVIPYIGPYALKGSVCPAVLDLNTLCMNWGIPKFFQKKIKYDKS